MNMWRSARVLRRRLLNLTSTIETIMLAKLKRSRSPSLDMKGSSSLQKSKKLKLLASHALASPFPDFPHPTPVEAVQVLAVLEQAHPTLHSRRTSPSANNNSARTCGSVPDVLESLIGTILSQNTSSRNSTAAKHSLDQVFGRNNFQAIVEAKKEAVVEAIKMGGLANKKAGVIQKILQEVKERHGQYSLQHLAGVSDGVGIGNTISDADAMKELVSYDGVGPKTASCVLLFCLGRSSFPVDTHVFRLSKLLGWVPSSADRVTAQAHLDIKIPGELKYGLHVLMVGHGRRCKGCHAGSRNAESCALKQWLRGQRRCKEEELECAVDVEEVKHDIDIKHCEDV